ncbi:hypothetical protein [Photobacterium galatheae]|uniref:Chromosome partitioning protein ParA n=1 Tax=Photobacterium galatheae TaxID=1654360 RepID=A0A066RM24_9GAMM|nr:hypothetical protein [Photobacterium galatheae]KDM91404.1 chromosome partitioning protein ParA [Photobacterium galatheae]MCM0151663.1 chromosome partitioning protein ParA [Photobacterium galatheae]
MADSNEGGITQREFTAFRNEMRENMQQQTELMRQMVELQMKHNNLESLVGRLDRTIEKLAARILPLEQSLSGNNEKTKYNRDLIWVLLLFVVGIASWKLKGG